MIQKQQEYENKNIRYAALLFAAIMSLNAKTYAAVREQLINWSPRMLCICPEGFYQQGADTVGKKIR